uniref:Flippase n=1 Tax=Syphacia muris TaxID=451379 RepID=A0A0N5AP41_9BILA
FSFKVRKFTELNKNTDYGALIIKSTAAVVIAISLALILLVISNMIYQSFTSREILREKVLFLILLVFLDPIRGLFIEKL